jgi:uncharacterized repeat protein (TIGR02059 family)
MRKVLMMFLCLVSVIASATDYYVSSSGNDSANGLSSSTPWQSISKVNSAFSGINPGDRILFKRGDVFYGTLRISRSGSSGSPITISAYGSGANPVISGFVTISGWNNYGGGIYSKTITCESSPNIVSVNGVNTPIGRWPNTGFLYIDSHVSTTSITDSELPSSPDWTGAEVVIRKVPFVYDRNIITDHSGTTLTYTTGSDYTPRDGYGYFIQNDLETLDKTGEWFYNGSTFYMYFGTADPNSYTVKVSTTDQLAYLLGVNYITFDNLSFEGGNSYAVQISNSDYITVQNCSINFTGNTAVFGPWNGTSPNCRITNNTISNSNNLAIELHGDHTNASVTNNTILNTGLIIGMGGNSDGGYMAMDINGENSLIQYNSIENTGYVGIKFDGNNTVVSNNLLNRFNLVKNDGGGIYTYAGTGTPNTGQKVTGNIILYGVGLGDGLPDKALHGIGIYMDDQVEAVSVTNNTVAHCNSTGIYLHNAHEITVNNNTLFDNGSGDSDIGGQILFVHDTYSPDDPIRNVTMNYNIFFAKTTQERVIAFSTTDNDISSFGTADYNCYAKPIDNSFIAKTWDGGWNSISTNRSLSNWQSYTGKDRNSYISPISLTDVSKIRFEYNASTSNKVVSLDGSYIDVKGTKYSGSITLLPYTSVVLMVDPNPTAPPSPPVYISSAIENGAPSIIELNYNLSLANVIPGTSAFSVQVNSAARSVSSVTVSGTKVLLTLSSPVAYGNTVTVSYTVPSSNPLQTPAGGTAASISAQSVTNRINAPAPPAVPVFSGASIGNSAPAVIELTFNLTLASTVPDVSAFSVMVNSAARSISSVSVSGTKVILTLASPVVNGDIVTVAYAKPSTNPLQTPEGGQAASISAQTALNGVNPVVTPPPVIVTPPPVVVTPPPVVVTPPPVVVTPPVVVPNTPPVVVVNYIPGTYSGFVGELNASGSYDADMDNLIFTWKIPNNISVSATNSSVIEFLAPIVETKQIYDFTLIVSDGKTTQSKTIPVEVLPYQPGLETAEVIAVEAGDFQTPYLPYNVIDGNIGTMWSAVGNDQWIILELKDLFNIQHVKVAFQPGQKKESYFDVLGSNDKENWEPVLTKSRSCDFSGDMQVFEFPPSKSEKEYRYIKLVGQGNSLDNWNVISEFRIFGFRHKNPTSYEDLIVKIYPNPAIEMVNILIDEPAFNPDFIKIVSLAGKILFTDKVDPGIRQFQVPVNFRTGIYIVQMGIGEMTMFTQKLVISR